MPYYSSKMYDLAIPLYKDGECSKYDILNTPKSKEISAFWLYEQNIDDTYSHLEFIY